MCVCVFEEGRIKMRKKDPLVCEAMEIFTLNKEVRSHYFKDITLIVNPLNKDLELFMHGTI